MNSMAIIGIAVSLALDAFAVSIASGVAIKKLRVRHAALIALFFGGFQALMPIVGWLSGMGLHALISTFDHWIAFGLLVGMGIKMIYESTKIEASEEVHKDPLNMVVLFVLAIATSIDALAVGVSFACLDVAIIQPALIIGGITFVMSMGGVYIGDRCGHFFEKKMEVLGGVVLILVGCTILFDSLL